jgi:hypothetical protein
MYNSLDTLGLNFKKRTKTNFFLHLLTGFQYLFTRYSEEMAKKSTVIGLPIVPFNQNKHSDMCLYLKYLEDFLSNLRKPKGVNTEESTAENSQPSLDASQDIKLPLCGDQLGRERVTGAKRMRLGCDAPSDRFENIYEYPALWHVKQSFLGVSAKYFLMVFRFTTIIYTLIRQCDSKQSAVLHVR